MAARTPCTVRSGQRFLRSQTVGLPGDLYRPDTVALAGEHNPLTGCQPVAALAAAWLRRYCRTQPPGAVTAQNAGPRLVAVDADLRISWGPG